MTPRASVSPRPSLWATAAALVSFSAFYITSGGALLLPVFALLMALQGLSQAIRACQVLDGRKR